jgi:hypothetical protein
VQGIAAGEEACISYGCVRKSNEQLMKDYGFVMPGNLNDRVPFSAGARGCLHVVLCACMCACVRQRECSRPVKLLSKLLSGHGQLAGGGPLRRLRSPRARVWV